MSSVVLSYSVISRMVRVRGLPWNFVKPQLILQRQREALIQHRCLSSQAFKYSSIKPQPRSGNSAPHQLGPDGQNPPENFDGGDYDETKNQEYEDEAERQAKTYRRIKKILSSAMFVSVLAYVGYSRRGKRQEVSDNIQNTKLLKDDGLFQGSENIFCVYQNHSGDSGSSKKVVLPLSIVKDGTIKKVARFELNDNDVVVASFPKAGCTWVQEIVYLLKNDLNFDKAQKQVLESRFPYIEYPYPGLASIEKMKDPRLLKTHLPYDNLPESRDKAKIIYVARNPKDSAVSYYHFVRMLTMFNFVGSFEEFLDKFQKDELPYCPFFEHINGYSSQKDLPNILIVTYEQLSREPEEVIRTIASFLGKVLSDAEIQMLVEHTRFENMANNASVNYSHWDEIGFRNKNEAKFMRKGKVGDWKNYLNAKENEKFDQWIAHNNRLQFPFVYE